MVFIIGIAIHYLYYTIEGRRTLMCRELLFKYIFTPLEGTPATTIMNIEAPKSYSYGEKYVFISTQPVPRTAWFNVPCRTTISPQFIAPSLASLE